jgi:hypothetical protein
VTLSNTRSTDSASRLCEPFLLPNRTQSKRFFVLLEEGEDEDADKGGEAIFSIQHVLLSFTRLPSPHKRTRATAEHN